MLCVLHIQAPGLNRSNPAKELERYISPDFAHAYASLVPRKGCDRRARIPCVSGNRETGLAALICIGKYMYVVANGSEGEGSVVSGGGGSGGGSVGEISTGC